jgi:hypothetical protein
LNDAQADALKIAYGPIDPSIPDAGNGDPPEGFAPFEMSMSPFGVATTALGI